MIREVSSGDFKYIAEFLKEFSEQNFKEEKYFKEFDYWWKDNPSFIEGDTMGWIIVDESKENYVKGFIGNIPIEYKIGGKKVVTYNASNWYVDPEYKKEAAMLAYAYFMQDKSFLLNTTPSHFTEQIFLKLGCKDFSLTQQSYMKIESKNVIKYFLNKKNINKNISNILSIVLFNIYKFLLLFIKKEYGYTLDEANSNINLSREFANTKKAYIGNMEWFLKDKNKKILLLKKQNKKIGYIIVQKVYNKINGLKYFQILDYENISLINLNSLINLIKEKFKIDKVDFVLISNFDEKYKYKKGFINITSRFRPICLIKTDIEIEDIKITSVFGEKGILFWE